MPRKEGQSEGQFKRPEYRDSHYLPGIHHQAWSPVDWWYPIPPRGGGGAKILYTIDEVETAAGDSPYNGLKVATVTIIIAPCDRTELIDTQVDVVDWLECLFNENNEDLVGRKGTAFEGIGESRRDPSYGPAGLTPCHWVADGLCCPPNE